MFWLTFLFQIFSYLCFCLEDLIEIDRPLLATGLRLNGTVARLPAWVHAEINPGQIGIHFLYKLRQPLKAFTNSYSLLSVAQLLGEITLKSFCIYQKALLLCLSHPLKKALVNHFE